MQFLHRSGGRHGLRDGQGREISKEHPKKLKAVIEGAWEGRDLVVPFVIESSAQSAHPTLPYAPYGTTIE